MPRNRLMMFVDGSNLLVELSRELGYAFRADRLPEPALAVSRKLLARATTFLGLQSVDIVRQYWFGSYAGDDVKLLEASQRLRNHGFEPVLFKSKGNGREKGVDIAVATSMLVNAFNQNYDYALLISGDEDYVSLLNEAKRHGPVVLGSFFEGSLSPALRVALDRFVPLNLELAAPLIEELRPQFLELASRGKL